MLCPFDLLQWPDEVLVGRAAGDRLCEELRPAPPELAAALRAEVEPRPGGRYAVRPQAPAFLLGLASMLSRGRLLLADYGGKGLEVHTGRNPVRTYVGGLYGAEPLEAPGSQDITADVDFGPLRRAARAAGLTELAYEPQEELASAARTRIGRPLRPGTGRTGPLQDARAGEALTPRPERHDRVDAAALGLPELDGAVVGLDEPLHDREPEP